jgi:hypothetical protein
VQDPVTFLSNIRDANGGAGKIYIEVPCFDWICTHRSWVDIFYEHVNYFRISDFFRMFGVVHEVDHAFGGQYIYIVADLATIRSPAYDATDRIDFPKEFLGPVNQYADRVKRQSADHQPPAIWGAASKGVIFALFMQRAGAKIDLVIDINRAKQGKYLAATGLRVQSPEEAVGRMTPGSDLFVMNSNYAKEIQEQTGHQFNYLLVDNDGA